jgi:cytochrome c biogenesis protein CcdA
VTIAIAIVSALVGGLILNLMPCVFPVLALKVLGFATHKDSRSTMRHEAAAFAGGVMLTFVALGAALAALRAGGEQLGWGFQLQSPAVVSALAILFFVLALNLSGVFEFGQLAPSGVTGWTSKNRTLDAFASGILAVVIASPCTAPFMGAALGLALTGSTTTMLLIFVALRPRHGLALRPARVVPRLATAASPPRSLARALQADAGVSVVCDGDLARVGARRPARQRCAVAFADRSARHRLHALDVAHRSHRGRTALGRCRARRSRHVGGHRVAVVRGRRRHAVGERGGASRRPCRSRLGALHSGHRIGAYGLGPTRVRRLQPPRGASRARSTRGSCSIRTTCARSSRRRRSRSCVPTGRGAIPPSRRHSPRWGSSGVPVYVLYRPGKEPLLLPEVLQRSTMRDALATL